MKLESMPDNLADESDETPAVEYPSGDYNPEFPGSTPDAPYGYKADGTPYTRRPRGSGKKSSSVAPRKSAKDAAAAAAMLTQLNALVAMSLSAFGLPQTAASIATANATFQPMAEDALASDPALCRKILSAGSVGGKTALFMAYGMLGASVYPALANEVKQKRLERMNEDGE